MSHRVIMSAFAFAFALTGAAHAAEVKRTIEIKGDRSQVWAKIGGWCAIADWHPVLAKCEETTRRRQEAPRAHHEGRRGDQRDDGEERQGQLQLPNR